MKFLALSLVVLFSASSFAATVSGGSKVYDMLDGTVGITITGESAKKLYDDMKGVRADDLGNKENQRVGENMTCNKFTKGRSKSYNCELTIENNKGKVGQGAHG